MHGVTQGHARAWNSVLECNGRRSPASNYRGSYSTGSYWYFMHRGVAQSRGWVEKGGGSALRKPKRATNR